MSVVEYTISEIRGISTASDVFMFSTVRGTHGEAL